MTHTLRLNLLPIHNGELSLDNSALSTYSQCPTSFLYLQCHRRESSENSASALNFGSGIHVWLENFHTHDKDVAFDGMRDHFTINPQVDPTDYRSYENAVLICKTYLENYGEKPDLSPILIGGKPAVELPFKCLMGEIYVEGEIMGKDRLYKGEWIKVYWTGKIDLVVKDDRGRVMLVDHKTTSMMGANYWTQFRLSGQFRGYCFAVNNLFAGEIGWCQRFMINALQLTYKGNIQLARQDFDLNKSMILEWQRKIMEDIKGMVSMAQAKEWSTLNWKSCGWLFGRPCQYLPICESAESTRSMVLSSGLYKNYNWNPLDAE